MVSCKLVLLDGSLDLACRRSFPSLLDGFSRAAGLSKVFPRSRLFSRYNVTYLDENATYEVDAVNGAFMMTRREAVNQVGLLDPDYFMYMEDLDWCFRFRRHGWRIFYFPETEVIHLKGRSGNENSSPMIREFFKSMDLFCIKNYFPDQSLLFNELTIIRNKVVASMPLLPATIPNGKKGQAMNGGEKMNFFIHNQRFCPRTLIMAQRYRNYLIDNGWKPSLQPDADLVLVFGCDFSMEEKNYALAQIRKFRAYSKTAPNWCLTGCLPSVRKDLKVPEPGTLVFGFEEAGTLDKIIGAKIPFDETPDPEYPFQRLV